MRPDMALTASWPWLAFKLLKKLRLNKLNTQTHRRKFLKKLRLNQLNTQTHRRTRNQSKAINNKNQAFIINTHTTHILKSCRVPLNPCCSNFTLRQDKAKRDTL